MSAGKPLAVRRKAALPNSFLPTVSYLLTEEQPPVAV